MIYSLYGCDFPVSHGSGSLRQEVRGDPLQRQWAGEPSLEALLVSLRPRLRRLFARYQVPVEEGEDILQQALLALVVKGQEVFCPEAWLLGTVRNRCLLYWRRRRRALQDSMDPRLLEALAAPTQPLQEIDDLRRDLEKLIGGLPLRCQRFFRLRYGEELALHDVSARLGYRYASMSKLSERCLSQLAVRARRLGFRLGSRQIGSRQ